MNTVNLGLAVLHVATGVFFATTGARKCFLREVRGKVHGLFDRYHVSRAAQWAVMLGELLGGLGLLFGCLTHLAALGLLLIMAGAYKLDTWPSVLRKQAQFAKPITPNLSAIDWEAATDWRRIDWSQLVSNALCTPEAQLLVIVATLALAGAGSLSLDALIWR